jgi:hypothetical protein
MKNRIFLLAFTMAGLLAACGEPNYQIVINNPMDVIRKDEPVVVLRDSLVALLGEISVDQVISVTDADGNTVASQCDDLDGDGTWDELFFVCDLAANQTVRFGLSTITKSEIPTFTARTYAQLKYSETRNNVFLPINKHTRPRDHVAQSTPYLYQFEGPGWENDVVAFRSYFDSRNGKDIFGKLTKRMVLDSVGLPGTNYHNLSEWGMDVLKVGQTLGAGSLAMQVNDSLYRLGPTSEANFRLIANGPVRSIIELIYDGWQVADEEFKLREVITMRPGTWYYKSKVTLLNDFSGTRDIVTGTTLLYRLDSAPEPNFVALNERFNGLITDGAQSENKDWLSMGILFDKSSCDTWFLAPESAPNDGVTLTACVPMKAESGKPVRYLFYAGWEKSDLRFKTEGLLKKVMEADAQRMANPVSMKLQKR